jgi:hypothetical protein
MGDKPLATRVPSLREENQAAKAAVPRLTTAAVLNPKRRVAHSTQGMSRYSR